MVSSVLQENRDAQFASENGQKPKPRQVASVHVFSSQEGAEFFFGAAIDACE
jgi:hypothetical protein